MAELNERQKNFARLLVAGVAQGKAYREAFDCEGKSDAAVRSDAHRLAKNADVLRFVAELSQRADVAAVLSREARMEMLSRMAERSAERMAVGDAVSCIRELNKMDGAYAQPDGVQVNVQQGLSIGDVVASVMGVNVGM